MGLSISSTSKNLQQQQQKHNNARQCHSPFINLSDDIMTEIFSYISNAPFEVDYSNPQAPLTHVLPLISKQFRRLSCEDILWIAAFKRLIKNHPNKWKDPLCSLLGNGKAVPSWSKLYVPSHDQNDFMLSANVKKMDTLSKGDFDILMNQVYEAVKNRINNDLMRKDADVLAYKDSEGKKFYVSFVISFIRLSLPVLNMPYATLRNGMDVSVPLIEAQYINFVMERMKGKKKYDFKKGKTLKLPRPTFIFANDSFSKGSTAFVVELCKCKSLQGRRMEVKVRVLKKVKLLSTQLRHGDENGMQVYNADIKRFSS
jgi:hypothetical protein